MKVSISDELENRVYPYYGMSINGTIVLFRSKRCGTVIQLLPENNTHEYTVGDYNECWTEEVFIPLVRKTITIEL